MDMGSDEGVHLTPLSPQRYSKVRSVTGWGGFSGGKKCLSEASCFSQKKSHPTPGPAT